MVKKTIQKIYNSKYGKKIRTVTGNRYGRGFNEIVKKGVPQMAKDLMALKKLLNVEKKRLSIVSYTQPIGQINGNATNHFQAEVTPQPAQGITASTRNGASIKLTGLYAKFQFYHQSATSAPMRIKVLLVKVNGAPQTFSAVGVNMYNYNGFVAANGGPSIIDYNSDRNIDTLKQYTILKQFSVYLPPDNVSGVQSIRDKTMRISFKNHHIKYDADTTTIKSGQLVLIALCDSGNVSGSTASTAANIPITAVNTGCIMNYDLNYYFVDN